MKEEVRERKLGDEKGKEAKGMESKEARRREWRD